MAPDASVRLLTRSGCHLCAEAEQIVERVCASRGAAYELVDVDQDPALRAEYTDHVPVLIVDGVVRSRWFVDEAALQRWL